MLAKLKFELSVMLSVSVAPCVSWLERMIPKADVDEDLYSGAVLSYSIKLEAPTRKYFCDEA